MAILRIRVSLLADQLPRTYGGVHYQLRSFLGTVQSKLTDCIKEVLFLGGGGGGVLAVNMILNRGL